MPVLTRSSQAKLVSENAFGNSLDGQSRGVLKESTYNEGFDFPALKTSHASVSLFTPRVSTRSQSKVLPRQQQLIPEDAVPMELEENEQAMQMLLRCSGKQGQENLAVTPENLRRTSAVVSPPCSIARNDRPAFPGVEFGCSSDPRKGRTLQQTEAKTISAAVDNTPNTGNPPARRESCKPGTLFRGRCISESHEPTEEDGQIGRIMVYVRLRPLSKKEKEAAARSCVRVVDRKEIYITEYASETDYLRLKRLRGRHFVFDASFHENTGQNDVYNISTAELVEGVLQGRNGSVFCYGATGAGKTYTMLGTVQNPGVMVLALKDLFTKLKQKSKDGGYVVRLSYLEVYNETVKDLLTPGRPLSLREDTKGLIVAAGLTQYQASSADEVMVLLQRGNQHRTTEPTRINETSSRSHAILQVMAEYKIRLESGSTVTRIGKLSLIDLAGSERALATDQRSLRSLEGANINRSLLALSSCINALVEGKKHIPFRRSKLTQLLKDSLGGSCQTAMIANISPSNSSFGETQNTLHWADRAKEIRTRVSAIEEHPIPECQEDQTRLLVQIQKENQQLKLQLARLQRKYLLCNNNAAEAQSPMSSSVPSTPTTARVSDVTRSRSRSPRSPCITAAAAREEKNAVEKVKELKKMIQTMERDAEKMRRENIKREEALAASISALHREHSVQLKQKEDLIKRLSQQKGQENNNNNNNNNNRVLTPSRSVNTDMDCSTAMQKMTRFNSPKATAISAAAAAAAAAGGGGGGGLPPHHGRPSAHEQKMKPTMTTRKALAEAKTVPATATPAAQRFYSPVKPAEIGCGGGGVCGGGGGGGVGKKRSFWDLGNAASPSLADRIRCTTARANAVTPSLLMQPGFLRRRQSPG